METRGHYILIGTFVLSIIAAAFIVVLRMSATSSEFDEYDIIFTERVSGLSVGAQVRFNGIQKGEVDTLKIDPENPEIVIARIRVGKDTPVKTDTRAELEPVGFTGLTIIQLVGGTANAEYLNDASGERVPVITADMSSFGALFEGSGDVIARASQLLSDENIQNFQNIITNVETVTGAVADNENEIAAILQNASKATEDLAALTERLERTSEGLEQIINGDAADAVAELEGLLSDLRGVVGENRESLNLFADQGLGQVAPALAEMRRLMRTLDYMLREIDRDPQAYFLGENTPEYEADEQ